LFTDAEQLCLLVCEAPNNQSIQGFSSLEIKIVASVETFVILPSFDYTMTWQANPIYKKIKQFIHNFTTGSSQKFEPKSSWRQILHPDQRSATDARKKGDRKHGR
jgi:hypothetical protein